jgi:RNA polymerase sigma-70 factor (ECF subfamily)
MGPISPERAVWLGRQILPHEPALRAWLSRKTVRNIEIDDIVQESYAILASLGSVAHISNPRAYLFRTAYSLILQQIRRANVVSIQAIEDLENFEAKWDAPSPEEEVSDRRELQRLVDILATLPARCGEAFRLLRIEGLSQREVASHMAVSENTVEKHIGKALRILSVEFGRGGKEGRRASQGLYQHSIEQREAD